MKAEPYKIYEMQQRLFWKIHMNTELLQNKRKIASKQLNLLPKRICKITNKAQVSRRKEVMKITVEINNIEIKKLIEKINKSNSWFFRRISKLSKPLARLIKKTEKRTWMNKVRNKRREILTNTSKSLKKNHRKYYEQSNKLDYPRASFWKHKSAKAESKRNTQFKEAYQQKWI